MMDITCADDFEKLAVAAIEIAKSLEEEHKHMAANAFQALSCAADLICYMIQNGSLTLTCTHQVPAIPEEKSPEWLAEVLKAHE